VGAGPLVGREGRLDPDLLERHVLRRTDRGDHREVAHLDVSAHELDRQDRQRAGAEIAFTAELQRRSGRVTADDLLAAGYTAEQALEVVTQVAYTTMANLAASVAETPVDAAFEAYAWAAA
jgi:alkylhydroperoxidase family enzyme